MAQFGEPVARADLPGATILLYDHNLLVGLPAYCGPGDRTQLGGVPQPPVPLDRWATVASVKAVVVHEFGGPDQMRLTDVPDPVAGPGQVRIAVYAAGTNPVDAGNRADGTWAGLRTPCILGYDVAGVVDQVGPGVATPALGQRVMAMTRFSDGAGGYAELVVVDAGEVAVVDPAMSFVDAAASPLAAGTALTVLDRLAPAPGARLLILGASGGVGLFLVQLAAAAGLEVIAVGRLAMHRTMSGAGARSCVDYAGGSIVEQAGPVDAIADLVGGGLLATALAALRSGGAIATIATPVLNLDPLLDNNLTLHGVLIRNDGQRTRRIAALLGSGSLRPIVSHVLPLDRAAEAHRILESGHSGGKVVLTV